ncbi:MAG: methylmalonyl-CoA epimerase [Bacteroidetes bacterium]|jgi:methylmalonyl-CoA/ethylmalonyl-CoA epimerase|nr:methylmalonyl-CoA epimerase [Bacteroidota bacterium]MBP6402074.1 methylmalonyl-CoA epimerase [Bacteroidia bacterium]MBK9524383.1 methylmalonyl-CoA epimerase [Bacteroidota bacterium]MBK9543548.1 methylmalonyl-CoA epimerase [Bacteroidota bacterium]MBL0256472.1 methylmalonyl-CoA epimerase [Bacteroidota bacterium]
MILRIEHLGIAVNNMENANRLFTSLLGTPNYKVETVESEMVSTSFFKVGESKIELVEATNPESPIAKFIAKKGEGIHHVAFEVDDIRQMMQQLREQGFQLLSDEPKKGADNKLICFLHPKSTNGVLVELCQEIR